MTPCITLVGGAEMSPADNLVLRRWQPVETIDQRSKRVMAWLRQPTLVFLPIFDIFVTVL